MDLDEDSRLLALLRQKRAQKDSRDALIDELRRKVAQLEEENRQKFKIISDQANTIRQYRAEIRAIAEGGGGGGDSLPASPPQQHPEDDDGEEVGHDDRNYHPEEDMKSTTPPPPLPTPPPPPPPPQIPTPAAAAAPQPSAATQATGLKALAKVRRLDEMVQESKIKWPTSNDSPNDFLVGQVIWDAIIRCFRKGPGAMLDEDMIIKECGKCLLTDRRVPFVDAKAIDAYFSRRYNINEGDKTMTVRIAMMGEKKVWTVFIPEWLKNDLLRQALVEDFPAD